ncbi:MAG: strawberry notch family protein [Pseudomonadota bacterium]
MATAIQDIQPIRDPKDPDTLHQLLDHLIETIITPIESDGSLPDPVSGARAADCSGQKLSGVVSEFLGTSHTSGNWSMRDAYDWLEAAMARYLMGNGAFLADDLPLLMTRSRALPTQTRRSEQQVRLQQFSTTLPLACLVAKAAQVGVQDIVLEPSAGTGLIAAIVYSVCQVRPVCHLDRQCPKEFHLNELSSSRRALLEANGKTFTAITGHDAALLRSKCPGLRPTVVVMNPPFSSSHRGEDKNTGHRHIRAAYSMLQNGGRLVSIVPEREHIASWAAALKLEGATVSLELTLPADAYRKNGTSQQVRLLVIDKGENSSGGVVVAKDLVQAARIIRFDLPKRLPIVHASAQRASPSKPDTAHTKSSNPTIKPLIKPLGQSADLFAADMDATDVIMDPPREGAADQLQDGNGLYVPYTVSRFSLPQGAEHPSPLVESQAMADTRPPTVTLEKPVQLTRRTLETKALSSPQLEAIIYAAADHEGDLPGRYRLDPETNAVTLATDDDDAGIAYRRGFFLGDGTGAGKGRQAAGIIQHNWLAGRTKAVWVSLSDKLEFDARRDWVDLGGLSSDIIPQSKTKFGAAIPQPQGILFTTYATLRQASRQGKISRLDQLVNWLGADFDGCLLFDESHAMGNMGGEETKRGRSKASAQAVAGLALQQRLPRARVAYISATGATKPANLAYASRLGLWGTPDAPFPSRAAFMSAMAKGGIAAMELVARDLKALGLYLSRSLSFDGVEYDILQHDLTDHQIGIYDRFCDAWQVIHAHIDKALEATGINDPLSGASDSRARAAAMSTFESTKQRFFAALLTGMKTPTLIKAMKIDLEDGHSCVVQLVSTGEAILNRRLADLSEAQKANLDIDLTPRDAVMTYLSRSFPVHQHELIKDENGTCHAQPVRDEYGRPILNPDAVAARDALMEDIGMLPPVPAALDQILAAFGTDQVAEATGRSKRVIVTADGQQKLETRSASSNLSETEAFMAGRKRILVFSEAGGTGRSYHASRSALNQQRRVHYLLEPGWKAATAIQGLGRTHRTNQASAPLFRPVTTNVKGEKRFISTIASRLEALGALTRGERKTGGQGLFRAADNLDSSYAKDALQAWYKLLYEAKLKAIPLDEFIRRTGLKLTSKDGTLLDELPPITKWLNRLLALPIAIQNAIFEEYEGLIEARVMAAMEAGTFDQGIEDVSADKIELLSRDLLRTDKASGAETYLNRIKLTYVRKPQDLNAILKIAGSSPRHVINRQSGNAAVLLESRTLYDEDGRARPQVKLARPKHDELMSRDAFEHSRWAQCDEAMCRAAWAKEASEYSGQVDSYTVTMLSGLILPLWKFLEADTMKVRRLKTDCDQALLGPILTDRAIGTLESLIGFTEREDRSPQAIWSAVISLGKSVKVDPITFKPRRSFGEARFENVGVPREDLAILKSFGCVTDIIQFKTHVFVPEDGNQVVILGKVLERYSAHTSPVFSLGRRINQRMSTDRNYHVVQQSPNVAKANALGA